LRRSVSEARKRGFSRQRYYAAKPDYIALRPLVSPFRVVRMK